jgi:hypothetical protein
VARARGLNDISGDIDGLDVYIKGGLFEPELSGGFRVRELSRQGFLMSDCMVSIDLKLKNIMATPEIYGDIDLDKGEISGPKTAVVRILAGKIFFKGSPEEPLFDLKGVSDVGGVRINIGLKGTVEKPDIRLSSDPSLPKGLLLLMLATNKSWKGSENITERGQVSADIVKDFVDYFFFAGTGSKIVKYFGISNVFLKYDEETKGVGVRKDISGRAEVTYSVEQSRAADEKPAMTQKIESELKVTDTVSIEAEREIKETSDTIEQEDEVQSSDKVLLKYKKEF